ncbi:hypothetical protein EVJ58_g9779 [Rhodofomes roseus]|uniref:DUF6534 domain-containing protein n=1 Tax=Rhodofomes roseus TaxID=34475 RepID=A0A4Y9XSW6_9APHY|nr:hypothetical protein EVJ58_g9779 [Rhodofomes roseus]
MGIGRWYQNYVAGVGIALAIISLACGLGEPLPDTVWKRFFTESAIFEVAAHDILTSINDVEAIQRVEVSGRIEGYTAVAVDVYITGALCFIFHRARTGYEPTENIIFKLMAFTINRGILLFVIQLLVIVTYKPNGTQALDGIYCFAGTLNVNCALASLNSRSGRGDLITSQLSSFDAPSGSFTAGDDSVDDSVPKQLRDDASKEK